MTRARTVIAACVLVLVGALAWPTAQQLGGAFVPSFNYDISGAWNFSGTVPTLTGGGSVVGTSATQTLTNKTLTSPTITGATLSGTSSVLTTPVIDGVTYSAANDRQLIIDNVTLSGNSLHSANQTVWTAPANAIVLRVVLNITTASTGASTIDIGYTATTATTSSDTMLDGVSGTPAAVFDSMDPALDSGANAHAQLAASGKWITADEATGDTSGMVAVVTIFYILV